MAHPIIQTHNLTVYYGSHRGIKDVNLTVEQGEIFGFLGPNGAGKTTTQRVLLDIIRPTQGRATVFGMDSQSEGVAIRERVGYLPGELSLYPNMKGAAFLDLMASLQGGHVDPAYRVELIQRMKLDPSRRMGQYSRGNKQKVGIVTAFMSKPDLLILDEPTGGLDPLMQQVVHDLVRETKADGRTVFFSSHILPEVQAVCDRVGIIRDGEIIQTARVGELTRQAFKRIHLTLKQTPQPDAFTTIEGVTETGREKDTIMLEVRGELQPVLEKALTYGVVDLDTPPVTLEETFMAYYNTTEEDPHA